MGVMDRDRCIKVSGLLGSTISMGEDLPVRFFCALSKRAQRYYLKLSIKGQHPNNKFRRLLCAFIWGTQVIYPSSLNNQVARPTVRRAQVSTHMSHLAVHHLAGRSTQGAGRSSQVAARSSGTSCTGQLAGRRTQLAARSSQLACPNRNSIMYTLTILYIIVHALHKETSKYINEINVY